MDTASQILLLDTNIYRRQGYNLDKPEYRDLLTYLDLSGGQLRVVSAVLQEYLSWLQDEINKHLRSLSDSSRHLRSFVRLRSHNLPEITEQDVQVQVSYLRQQVLSPCQASPPVECPDLNAESLVEFFIRNKKTTTRNNVRDLIIATTLVHFAMQNSSANIYFISADSDFISDSAVRQFSGLDGIQNLQLCDSITTFLHQNGFNLDFFSSAVLEEFFTESTVDADIDTRHLFDEFCDHFGFIEMLDYDEVRFNTEWVGVDDFYSFRNPQTGVYCFYANLALTIVTNLTFGADENIPQITAQFSYTGTLDVENKSISTYELVQDEYDFESY